MASLHALRRVFVSGTALMALVTASVGVATAAQPGRDGWIDPPSYIEPGSHAEAAYRAKLALASRNEAAEKGATSPTAGTYVLPDGPQPIDPPQHAVLDTRARRQNNDHYCGPAAGQVLINYTRYYWYDTLDGENASTNYKTQSDLGAAMNTDSGGTWGRDVARVVNDYARLAYADFYQYQAPSDGSQFHSWVVSDIADYVTPLIPGIVPHDSGVQYYLPNWANTMTIPHFVVIRGYDGFWDGTNTPTIYYSDSASPLGPGRYSTGAKTMWKVTTYLAGKVVW